MTPNDIQPGMVYLDGDGESIVVNAIVETQGVPVVDWSTFAGDIVRRSGTTPLAEFARTMRIVLGHHSFIE